MSCQMYPLTLSGLGFFPDWGGGQNSPSQLTSKLWYDFSKSKDSGSSTDICIHHFSDFHDYLVYLQLPQALIHRSSTSI